MKNIKKIAVSIGIAAYNEEHNIGRLIESIQQQKVKSIKISEILIISSGSTDKTNAIVKSYAEKKYNKIKLIRQSKRLGKASAVNLILTRAKKDIIVLVSADILLERETIERLVIPLKRKQVGIVGSRPIPLNNRNTLYGFAAHLLWNLHHLVSLKTPKMGECIAFRKVFKQIPILSSVDEANIESLIKGQGFRAVYEPTAIVYNMGAQNFTDYVARRRHIYAGHLATMNEYGYAVSTIRGSKIILLLIKNFQFTWRFVLWTPLIIALEICSRLLGFFDYTFKWNTHTVWRVTKSTKHLPLTPTFPRCEKESERMNSWSLERLDPLHASWYSKKLILEHIERYSFAMKYTRDKIVVDLGSGSGYGSKIIAENGAKKVYSCDIDPTAISYAEKFYAHRNIKYFTASAENTNLPSNTADVVLCFEVIEHLKNPEKLILESYRILKPGGICIISTPNKKTSYGDNPYHIREFTLRELIELTNQFSGTKLFGQRKVNKFIISLYLSLHRLIPSPFFRLVLRFRPWENYKIEKIKDKNFQLFLYFLTVCQK